MPGPLDADVLKTWTTSSLVLHIATYAVKRPGTFDHDRKILEANANLVAAELNARIPPRVMPS